MAEFKNLDITALPEGWGAGHFGELVDYALGRTPPRNDASYWKEGIYPWVSISDMKPHAVVSETAEKVTEKAFDKVFRGQLVPEGSLLMSFKLTIGRVSRLGMPALHNEAIISFRPEPTRVNEDYLAYYLSQINYKDYQDTAIKGQTLNKGKIDSLEIALPPIPEQQRIAQVLSTVQQAVEQQERLIRTTTELKQSLMQKLFTEGLRGEAQKETEIGMVPEGWEVVYCEDVCEKITVGIVVQPVQYYVPEGVPALRSQNIRVNKMQMEPMIHISKEANEGPVRKSRLAAGDVLIVRTGANVGMSCVLPDELDGCNCIDLLILRTDRSRLRGSFLSRFVNTDAAKLQVGAGKIGLAQPHFNVGSVRRMLVPLPPLEEQYEIVRSMEAVDQRHDIALKKRQSLQDLFRTLLHELMTGKVRVRELDPVS